MKVDGLAQTETRISNPHPERLPPLSTVSTSALRTLTDVRACCVFHRRLPVAQHSFGEGPYNALLGGVLLELAVRSCLLYCQPRSNVLIYTGVFPCSGGFITFVGNTVLVLVRV